MDEIISSVKNALGSKNYFGALFISVCLPDICGEVEYGNDKLRYKKWFEANMPERYSKFVTGGDAYAIRCAVLHQASNDLSMHEASATLDKYYFTPSNAHLILIDNLNHDHIKRCVISIEAYANDILSAFSSWKTEIVAKNADIQTRFDESELNRIKINVGADIPGLHFG